LHLDRSFTATVAIELPWWSEGISAKDFGVMLGARQEV